MPASSLQQPLLLIPGTMCDERLWRHQVSALESDCAGIQVADITMADTIAGLARLVLQDAPERFSLAGFSMGGIIALEMWRQAPERIMKLALLDTNARTERPERQAPRLEQMQRVRQGKLREVITEDLMPHYLGSDRHNDTGLQQEILDMALSLGPEVFLRQCHALNTRPDSTATLATVHCPSLVLCGREDRLCPDWMHQQMAESIPGARLEVIEHSGHFSVLEAPHEVSGKLKAWLASSP